MTGATRGVVGRLKDYVKIQHNISFQHFHCIIHQQVLCSKLIKIDNLFKKVNFIHREFTALLNDVEYDYKDFPYYIEVRWLSSHKVLKRFLQLLEEIVLFLEIKDYDCSELKDVNWIQDLAFLVDITGHLSQLNINLQGKNMLMTK